MASQAPFVFHGTVIALGKSTEALLEAGDRTAVVRVDAIVRAPDAMRAIVGREITVQLRQPAAMGEKAEFSARGLLYGTSLAVQETGKRKAVTPQPASARRLSGASADSAKARDQASALRASLKARAAEASSVVVGRVTGIMEAAAAAAKPRESEHDPHWATATVVVDQVIKGTTPKTVKVMFANSQDVMWYRAPKLAVGQRAVLLLRKGAPGAPDKRSNVVMDEFDVQSVDRAQLVASLL